jgi:hypothetical protein
MRVIQMMKTILTIASILAIGLLTDARATSFSQPEDRTVKSPNGEYQLDIHAESGLHDIRKDGKVLWSFTRQVWHDEFHLSNDGQRVLWVAWKHVQAAGDKSWMNRQAEDGHEAEAIAVYSPDGLILKKTFAEVSLPKKREGPGPIGDFWRIWREGETKREGDAVSIPVTGKDEAFRIDLAKVTKP